MAGLMVALVALVALVARGGALIIALALARLIALAIVLVVALVAAAAAPPPLERHRSTAPAKRQVPGFPFDVSCSPVRAGRPTILWLDLTGAARRLG